MKLNLIPLLLFALSFPVFAANAPSCAAGQELICIPNECSNGSIGCRENPPQPTCFCAIPPETQDLAPQDFNVVFTESGSNTAGDLGKAEQQAATEAVEHCKPLGVRIVSPYQQRAGGGGLFIVASASFQCME